MEYAVSDDNRTLRTVATLENQSAQQTEGPFTQRFAANLDAPTTARFLRVHARSITTIPGWHDARGRKAWLFADEIMVE